MISIIRRGLYLFALILVLMTGVLTFIRQDKATTPAYVAFSASTMEGWFIYKMRLVDSDSGHIHEGITLKKLTNMGNEGIPAWSPDGQRIAFVSGYEGAMNVYVMRSDGSQIRSLTDEDSFDWYPVWSPDGEWIAFVSDRDDGENYEIYRVRPDSDGTDVEQLTDFPDSKQNYPTFSPDGEWLAFSSNHEGFDGIYKMRLLSESSDARELIRVARMDTVAEYLTWSPDGEWLAFSVYPRDHFALYLIPAGAAVREEFIEPVQLTDGNAADTWPAWSPDGSWLVFMTLRKLPNQNAGQNVLYRVAVNDEVLSRAPAGDDMMEALTPLDMDVWAPAVSPAVDMRWWWWLPAGTGVGPGIALMGIRKRFLKK